jgi:hypothetical protein
MGSGCVVAIFDGDPDADGVTAEAAGALVLRTRCQLTVAVSNELAASGTAEFARAVAPLRALGIPFQVRPVAHYGSGGVLELVRELEPDFLVASAWLDHHHASAAAAREWIDAAGVPVLIAPTRRRPDRDLAGGSGGSATQDRLSGLPTRRAGVRRRIRDAELDPGMTRRSRIA